MSAPSSYSIERENANPDKESQLVATLKLGGTELIERPLSEKQLTQLQNQIVDQRHANDGFSSLAKLCWSERSGRP